MSGSTLTGIIAQRVAQDSRRKLEYENEKDSILIKPSKNDVEDFEKRFDWPEPEFAQDLSLMPYSNSTNDLRRVLSPIDEALEIKEPTNSISNLPKQPQISGSNLAGSIAEQVAMQFKQKAEMKNQKEFNSKSNMLIKEPVDSISIQPQLSTITDPILVGSIAEQAALELKQNSSALDKAITHKRIDENNELSLTRPDLSAEQFPLDNDDQNLIVIKKKPQPIEQIQNVHLKFLKPPPLPPPGDIVIHQEPDIQLPAEPPLYIRETIRHDSSSDSKHTLPKTIVIREKPPSMPEPIPEVHLTIPGKVLPPPPRQIIVERFPSRSPSPPPTIVYEKWLPYEDQMNARRVVFIQNENLIDAGIRCLNSEGGIYRRCSCRNCYYFENYNNTGKYFN